MATTPEEPKNGFNSFVDWVTVGSAKWIGDRGQALNDAVQDDAVDPIVQKTNITVVQNEAYGVAAGAVTGANTFWAGLSQGFANFFGGIQALMTGGIGGLKDFAVGLINENGQIKGIVEGAAGAPPASETATPEDAPDVTTAPTDPNITNVSLETPTVTAPVAPVAPGTLKPIEVSQEVWEQAPLLGGTAVASNWAVDTAAWIVGSPVDSVTNLMNGFGANITNPIGGSASLRDAYNAYSGAVTGVLTPQTIYPVGTTPTAGSDFGTAAPNTPENQERNRALNEGQIIASYNPNVANAGITGPNANADHKMDLAM